MMQENLRKLLVSVAVSALLAGPVLAEGNDPGTEDGGSVSVDEPDVSVDPAQPGDGVDQEEPGEDLSGGDPDMWTGGTPDFCEACNGEPVDEPATDETGGDDSAGGDGVLNDPVDDLGVDPTEIDPRIRETAFGGEGLSGGTLASRSTVDRSGGECVWTPRQMHCRD